MWFHYPCRIWDGGTNNKGYGVRRRSTPRQTVLVHRDAWEQAHGPLPKDVQVLHHCDIPLCYEVEHLFEGTQQNNLDDMVAKGRHWNQVKTHCKYNHPLTGDNLFVDSRGKRVCRSGPSLLRHMDLGGLR